MTDVLIIGGGVVGKLAATHLKHQFPEFNVTLVGRTDIELPVVGESLVEVSTQFMRSIGLGRHLVENQLPKYGLTFYYKRDPSTPSDPTYFIDEGPASPPLLSFLINRATFDEELSKICRNIGVNFIAGNVKQVKLGDGRDHTATVELNDGNEQSYTSRWLIDCTGRRRFLARQLGLNISIDRQRTCFWFRLADFDLTILDRIRSIKKENNSFESYYVAHHIFGQGNWIWMIPLRSDDGRNTISIGITYRPDIMPQPIHCMEDFLDWVGHEHPVFCEFVRSGVVVDTNLYRNYMYSSRQRYSRQGWFIIGDAADTLDPLYSTGFALASVSIQQVSAMIQRSSAGTLTDNYVHDLDSAYFGSLSRIGTLIQDLYETMHDWYRCHLRMQSHVTMMFHATVPMIMNHYYTDDIGVKIVGLFGNSSWITREMYALIDISSDSLRRRGPIRSEHFLKVQSSFTLNHSYFEYSRDQDIPNSISQLFRYFAMSQLRMVRIIGIRSIFNLRRITNFGVLSIGIIALYLFGKTSLIESRLVRWVSSRWPDSTTGEPSNVPASGRKRLRLGGAIARQTVK